MQKGLSSVSLNIFGCGNKFIVLQCEVKVGLLTVRSNPRVNPQ